MILHCPKGHPVVFMDEVKRWHCPTCRTAYLRGSLVEQEENVTPTPKPRPRRLQRYHLGIDPGATTGIALLDDDGQLVASWVVRWSDAQDARGGHDLEVVAAELARICGARHATRGTAERPEAAKKGAGSVKSWVGLGAYLGRVEQALFRALGFYPERIAVTPWREAVGLPAKCTKEQSIARAQQVPGALLVTDHNAAEAVLIAEAGRLSVALDAQKVDY